MIQDEIEGEKGVNKTEESESYIDEGRWGRKAAKPILLSLPSDIHQEKSREKRSVERV